VQDGLRRQNRAIDERTLTPLTPEVISRQATINIGTIGHVAHGKSTTVKALSGVNVSVAQFQARCGCTRARPAVCCWWALPRAHCVSLLCSSACDVPPRRALGGSPWPTSSRGWGLCVCVCGQTMKGRNEQIRNITIKLGYANAKIYKSSEA
jgi:hypothetical protein